MTIAKEEVRHLFELAALEEQTEDLETLSAHLESLLSYVSKLNDIDTESVEPMNYVHSGHTASRADTLEPSMDRNEGMSNVPHSDDGYILVPKVIDNS